MTRPSILSRLTMALAVVVLVGTVMAGEARAVPSPTPPHIVATPNNVMVNTIIHLVGTGFPARTQLTIAECGRTNWVVGAQQPCNTDNTISVVTNRRGRFAAQFKAEVCPDSVPPTPPVTRRTCYIGNPQPRGVDTITLVGAAKIIVTYP